MESYVIVLQNADGSRVFYAANMVPCWTYSLGAASQYMRRHEAEVLAERASARVMTWHQAWEVADDLAVEA